MQWFSLQFFDSRAIVADFYFRPKRVFYIQSERFFFPYRRNSVVSYVYGVVRVSISKIGHRCYPKQVIFQNFLKVSSREIVKGPRKKICNTVNPLSRANYYFSARRVQTGLWIFFFFIRCLVFFFFKNQN